MKGKQVVVVIGVVALLSVTGFAAIFASRSSADPSAAAPDWLLTATQQAVALHSGQTVSADSAPADAPKTATWALTTVAVFDKSLPETSAATSDSSKPLYVVVVDGKFTASHGRPGSPIPTGSQLLLVFDADTRALSGVGVLNTPIDETVFDTVGQMAL